MKANAVIPLGKKTGVSLIEVDDLHAGMRMDRFLKQHLPGVPSGLIHKLLRTGQVRLNGGRVKGDERLKPGGKVRIPPLNLPEPADPDHPAPPPAAMLRALEGSLLLEGEGFMVINKPPGWPVHGGTGQISGLIDGLRYLWKDSPHRPELCHRLDRDTSGCLLLATDRRAAGTLTAAFREGTVKKTYLTLVQGIPHPAEGVIESSLIKGMLKSGERMVVTNDSGRSARTRYRVSERFRTESLLDITLDTGRTHQVRAHLQSVGHPLAGDGKYGDRAFNRRMKEQGLKRMFLHARNLIFPHPVTGTPVRATAPLDPALVQLLDHLRQSSKTR
ncbi:MAG: RluA family pseudouridine synthase [Magnetococcales bacterium]|nr:RluA family pseudouridine synthase [Magnetococcales bacterium]MBF0149491.1 RluA family pseudouridine synthase [Magnetococcales bacterium]MBF0171846.1 RluA family pseudouridine synthase [Magnetococcales bacterium]MBF0631340.1 RluA family pseudouridine synthase [Magnetococcales bacterium]